MPRAQSDYRVLFYRRRGGSQTLGEIVSKAELVPMGKLLLEDPDVDPESIIPGVLHVLEAHIQPPQVIPAEMIIKKGPAKKPKKAGTTRKKKVQADNGALFAGTPSAG